MVYRENVLQYRETKLSHVNNAGSEATLFDMLKKYEESDLFFFLNTPNFRAIII